MYCPPVVPQGRTELYPSQQDNVGFGRRTYFLSFRSRSLAESPSAFAHDPHEGHWVVAAARPAKLLATSLDTRARYPNARSYFGEHRRFTSTSGVRVAVLTGNTSSAGFASGGHAIVYWTMDDTGYMVSVHFSQNVSIAERMAGALIEQIRDCQPNRSPGNQPQSCGWVYQSG